MALGRKSSEKISREKILSLKPLWPLRVMMPLMLLVLTLETCGSCSTASVSANRPMPHGPGLQLALQKARWSTRREGRPGKEEEAGHLTATLALLSITVPAGCSSQLCRGRCPGAHGRAGQQQWHAHGSRLPPGVAAAAGLDAGRACGQFDGRAALRLRGGGRAFRERTTEKAHKRRAMLKAAAKVCAYAIRTSLTWCTPLQCDKGRSRSIEAGSRQAPPFTPGGVG